MYVYKYIITKEIPLGAKPYLWWSQEIDVTPLTVKS